MPRPSPPTPIPATAHHRPDQLALALEGTATHAYAVCFIVTNIPTHDQVDQGEQGQTVRDVEAWFRRRTDIENRIREAKLGAGLRHLPSAHTAINAVWMWGRGAGRQPVGAAASPDRHR